MTITIPITLSSSDATIIAVALEADLYATFRMLREDPTDQDTAALTSRKLAAWAGYIQQLYSTSYAERTITRVVADAREAGL